MKEPQHPICRPLPESRHELEMMLKLCEKCLDVADPARHRNERLWELSLQFADGKITFEALKHHEAEMQSFRDRQRNDFIPDAESLWPYCDPVHISKMKDCFELGSLATSEEEQMVAFNEGGVESITQSIVLMVSGQRLHVRLLRELRTRITAVIRNKRADVRADTENILAEAAPLQPDIALLHAKLIREGASGKSQRSIAIDFTDGDVKRAESLLRGVRRFRKRLDKAAD